MDISALPHASDIPGRQKIIDHAGRIDRQSFLISTGILFGLGILFASSRLVIWLFSRRNLRWDDGFVLIATAALAAAYGTCLKALGTLYLTEATQRNLVIPFQEEIPEMLDLVKWATIFAAMNWTSVYMVKLSFEYFFYTLIRGMARKYTIFYWTTVAATVVFWLFTTLDSIVICPHWGADAAQCSKNPNQHARSLTVGLLVACLDIISDIMIVALPIAILRQSMMPFSRKVSLGTMLCLSIAMIVCAIIRLVGTISDTRPDREGAAPVWGVYWSFVEGCISLIMTSVMVIRGAFISQVIHDDQKNQNSLLRLGGRLLSTLRFNRSSRSSQRSPPYPGGDQVTPNSSAPQIASQGLTQFTMSNVRRFIKNGQTKSESRDDGLLTVDTAYIMEDLDYHNIRKKEVKASSINTKGSNVSNQQSLT